MGAGIADRELPPPLLIAGYDHEVADRLTLHIIIDQKVRVRVVPLPRHLVQIRCREANEDRMVAVEDTLQKRGCQLVERHLPAPLQKLDEGARAAGGLRISHVRNPKLDLFPQSVTIQTGPAWVEDTQIVRVDPRPEAALEDGDGQMHGERTTILVSIDLPQQFLHGELITIEVVDLSQTGGATGHVVGLVKRGNGELVIRTGSAPLTLLRWCCSERHEVVCRKSAFRRRASENLIRGGGAKRMPLPGELRLDPLSPGVRPETRIEKRASGALRGAKLASPSPFTDLQNLVSEPMPLPPAHFLVGAGAADLAAGELRVPRWKIWMVGGILGVLPDMDTGLGILLGRGTELHGIFTHTPLAALLVGLVTWLLAGRRWALIATAAYASHLLIDLFEDRPGSSVQPLWPLSDRTLDSVARIIPGVPWESGEGAWAAALSLLEPRIFAWLLAQTAVAALLFAGLASLSAHLRSHRSETPKERIR